MSKSSANGAEREVLVGDGGGESLGECIVSRTGLLFFSEEKKV